jgi:DNA polymerase-4
MPGVRARRLCPQAVFLPPDFDEYSRASRAVMRIFREVTPLVEPLSMDEAFLDVAGSQRLLGPPARIAASIRARVAEEQSLPCSVGVAPSKFVAKLASTRAKPDGTVVVPAARVLDFLHPLPVGALWGVGERSAEVLHRLGLRTVGDLAAAPVGMLRSALGEAAAQHLHELAWARDPRAVVPEHVEQSIGAEVTFDVDVDDPVIVRRTLLALARRAAGRLRGAGQVGRTVSIKVRLADFRTLSRSRTLPGPTDVTNEIFETAWALYDVLRPGDRIRLLGVRIEGLLDADRAPRQLELGTRERGWAEADRAADAAIARFGAAAVQPASLLVKGPARVGESEWTGAPGPWDGAREGPPGENHDT